MKKVSSKVLTGVDGPREGLAEDWRSLHTVPVPCGDVPCWID